MDRRVSRTSVEWLLARSREQQNVRYEVRALADWLCGTTNERPEWCSIEPPHAVIWMRQARYMQTCKSVNDALFLLCLSIRQVRRWGYSYSRCSFTRACQMTGQPDEQLFWRASMRLRQRLIVELVSDPWINRHLVICRQGYAYQL